MTRIHIQGHALKFSLRKLLTLSKWQYEIYEQHCSRCLANFEAGLLDLCWVFPSPTGLSVTYDHPTGVSGLMNCKPINDEQEVVFVSLSLWIKLERTPNPATILRLFWVINFGHFFCLLTNVVIFARNPWLFLVMLNFVVIVVIHSGSFCHKDSQGKLLEFFLRIIWMNFTTVYLTGKPGFN